jgi:hypothetical protein
MQIGAALVRDAKDLVELADSRSHRSNDSSVTAEV